MAIELRQQLRLSQQLVMTPQLQQAIKLLQLNRQELTALIEQELQENAFLEVVEEREPDTDGNGEVSLHDFVSFVTDSALSTSDDREVRDWCCLLRICSLA